MCCNKRVVFPLPLAPKIKINRFDQSIFSCRYLKNCMLTLLNCRVNIKYSSSIFYSKIGNVVYIKQFNLYFVVYKQHFSRFLLSSNNIVAVFASFLALILAIVLIIDRYEA